MQNKRKPEKSGGKPRKKGLGEGLRRLRADLDELDRVSEEIRADPDASAEIIKWIVDGLETPTTRYVDLFHNAGEAKQRSLYNLILVAFTVGVGIGRKACPQET